jgi:hypothetical protein
MKTIIHCRRLAMVAALFVAAGPFLQLNAQESPGAGKPAIDVSAEARKTEDLTTYQKQNATPRVRKIENLSTGNPKILNLTNYLRLHVDDLKQVVDNAPALDNDPSRKQPIILYLSSMPIKGLYPVKVDTFNKFVTFCIERDTSSASSWNFFYKKPRTLTKIVDVSLGYEGMHAIPTDAKTELVIIHKISLWVILGFIALLFFAFIRLARRTDMLRDESTAKVAPFSLSRSQFAFWTVLIASSYTVIWVCTGDMPELTGSTLILLGISSGTTIFAKIIDQNQSRRSSDHESQGFITDILSDEKGISIPRFQVAVFTLILGIIFISKVISNFEMPQFDDNLLILMGISNATYTGMKTTETTAPAVEPKKKEEPENSDPDSPGTETDTPAMG